MANKKWLYSKDNVNKSILTSLGYIEYNKTIYKERNNGDGPHYFFNKKNTVYAKMLICQDIVELNQKQIYIM